MKKLGSIIDNLRQGQAAPTRHYNPYFAEALTLNEYLYTEAELSEKKDFLFEKRENKLVIEIGCYMGKNVIEMALQNKSINFIGLDITYKRAVKASKKLKNANITNAKIALCDGKLFLQEFAKINSIHGVCVFFPDPWPKERHEKNRLLAQEFIELLKEKLEPDGFFWFKTDAHNYFIQTEKLLLESGFLPDDDPLLGARQKPKSLEGGPYETAFQKIFSTKQVPFYQRVYIKQ